MFNFFKKKVDQASTPESQGYDFSGMSLLELVETSDTILRECEANFDKAHVNKVIAILEAISKNIQDIPFAERGNKMQLGNLCEQQAKNFIQFRNMGKLAEAKMFIGPTRMGMQNMISQMNINLN